MNKELYLISGLGADKRVFDYVDLRDFKLNHIEWVDPLEKESIEAYARRLLQQIPSTKPTLIGVSFGGIIAIEIGKLIETEKIILISSARTKADIPGWFRISGIFSMNNLIPSALYSQVNFMTLWFFGLKKKWEKELFKAIMEDTDNKFLGWAIEKLVCWDNEKVLPNVSSIHGTADKVLPIKAPDYKVIDGGHLMVVSKAKEVGDLIKKILG